jgi:predicted membrane-bound spermidine synthase
MLFVLSLLFVLSGAAGLFYESVWARYLGLFVGHSAYAQVIVLVIFLGGMAIGAWIVGRITERIRDPLFGYALVEALIGLMGLFFHASYVGVTNWAYASVFPGMAGSAFLTTTKWGLAALLILPQSILLGATFPMMSAGVLRRIHREPGRTLALLYFANSLGAAVGVLVAGFYLVRKVGLPGTIQAAASLNLLVALGALLARQYFKSRDEDAAKAVHPEPSVVSVLAAPSVHRLLLWVSFGTAFTSFIYEIAWIRMLALVLSSATHAFDLMLSAFILGLALGSFWVRSRADRFRDPLRVLAFVQWAMGFLALATLPLYFLSFGWTATLFQTFAPTEPGYTAYCLARYAICLLIMLPATFCAGITLPLITRTLVLGGVGERAIGQVYSFNTAGSIFGAAIAALILLPLVGLKYLLAVGALLDMGIGVLILLLLMHAGPGARRLGLIAAGGVVAVAIAVILSPAFDRGLLISGVFRYGFIPPPGMRDILYYADGRTATASVERSNPSGDLLISTNGKSDGALPSYWFSPCDSASPKRTLDSDAATMTTSALITLAHKPDGKTGAVIGQGTGLYSHLMLGSPHLADLYTIEIEPEMIRASRAFYPANRRVFDDPRAHFVLDDAKSYFAAAGRKYDFIFSEPSNPWVGGVSGLFTMEFYDRVTQHLQPDGVFAQWIHLFGIDDQLVMTVLAALHRKFEHYEVFLPAANDVLVIATNGAAVPQPDWGVLQLPEITRDLCHQVPFTSEAMEATRLGNEVSFGPLVGSFPQPNSDFFPHLDSGAAKAAYMRRRADGFENLNSERFDITAPFIKRRTGPAHFTLVPTPGIPRINALALGAALRQARQNDLANTNDGDAQRTAAIYRQRSWESELNSDQPPLDWRLWLQQMRNKEQDRYGGTQGYVDEDFYAPIYRFLDRHQAPAEVRAAVDFRHGIHGWDFGQAVRATPPLLAAAMALKGWLPADELRDGAVVARLIIHDVGEAREVFNALTPYSARPAGDLRSALLASYIQAMGAARP